MSDQLALFDVLLTLGGVRLNKKLNGSKQLADAVSWFMRVYIIISYSYLLYQRSHKRLSFNSVQKDAYLATSFIHMILFAVRRRRLKRLLSQICCSETSKRVHGYSWSCIVFAVLITILQMTATILRHPFSDNPMLFIALVFIAILGTFYSFLILYPLYYVLVLRIMKYYEYNKLTQCMTDIANEDELLKQIDSMIIVRQEFESLFNIVPFAVSANLFTLVPLAAINMANTRLRIFSLIFSNFLVLSMILLMVHQINRLQSSSGRLCNQLLRLLQMSNKKSASTMGQLAIMQALYDLKNSKFTGLRLFAIDDSFLLTLASSLITFSVLTCQLVTSFNLN